jgi:hypothetical protein
MNSFLYIMLLLKSFTGLLNGEPVKDDAMNIISSGFINIEVESNVNKLTFEYDIKKQNFVQRISIKMSGEEKTILSAIIVPVVNFKCSNHFAFNDFISLLKADKYPNMKISFPVESLNYHTGDDKILLRNVDFNVAGVTRTYDILCSVINENSGKIMLSGYTRLRLTDFEITPPVRSLGFVRVKNEIIVKFGFSLNRKFLTNN